jgi:chromosome partitioning protein
MMILIGGEKGGTGKTTLATNLAALRALAGRDVLLLDTDLQGSASYWSQTRDEANITPRVACLQKFGKGLQIEIQDLAKRYDDIIIDAGGRDSIELRAGLVVAEKVYIPIQASQFDVWTLGRMNALVEQARGFNPELEAYIVISRASTNPAVSEAKEAQDILSDFEHCKLADTIIRDRIAYRKAARDGLCVSELKPVDSKASAEVGFLYREVFGEETAKK